MKAMFKDMCENMKNIKITKHYDCSTQLSCGKSDGEPFTMTLKGDYSVNAIEIAFIVGTMALLGISCAVARRIRN